MTARRWMAVTLITLAAAWPAAAQQATPQYPRLLHLAYNPIIEFEDNQRLWQAGGWMDPAWLTDEWIADFQESSHGLVNFRLVQYINADEFPIHTDGYRYTDAEYMEDYYAWSGWHDVGTDYKASCRDYDWARKVDAGMIDEVIIYTAPFTGYWETTMCGRGGYWCNSSPQKRIACSRIFIIEGLNYERGVAEGIHSYGHRAESIMAHTYGGWNTNGTRTLFDRFGWNYGQTTVSNIYGIGSIHYPPNGRSDYDYASPVVVESYAPGWMNHFPDFAAESVTMGYEAWGGPDTQRNFLKWWYAHLPHHDGSNNLDGYNRLNNWWEYVQNFNMHSESGGDHEPGGPVPPAASYPDPLRVLTFTPGDDWVPQVNDAGRVVWQGHDGEDFEIYSSNMDGTGLVQITDDDLNDEAPQINASGRIVWQKFDGQDYEILTANADGTDVRYITNNTVYDWHPDISDSGWIVWDRFDGLDYEIYSAMADASVIQQVTYNTNGGVGRPRDDVWPRINDATPPRITWAGWDGSDWEIYSANVDGSDMVNVSNNSREDEYPQINDNGRIVWHAFHDVWNDADVEVWSANADGSGRIQLTNDGTEDWWPQINNSDVVVWMARTGGDWEIERRSAYGGATFYVTSNDQHDQYPRIDDFGRIVWQGFDGSDWEIYMFTDQAAARGGVIYQVSDNDYDDRWPAPAGSDAIVWHAESVATDSGPTTEIWAAGNGVLDLVPPAIESVRAADETEVQVVFTERLEPVTAEDPANYTIDGGVTVSGATLTGNDGQAVMLTVSPMNPDQTYTLAVSGVEDVGPPGLPVAPDTQVEFTYTPPQRATEGLLVLYDFAENDGTVVHDVSGVGEPLDLNIEDPQNAVWTGGGLAFVSNSDYTRAISPAPAAKVITGCQATDEVTIEAWVIPASAVDGDYGRIVTVSQSNSARNFTLGHGDTFGGPSDQYTVRLRTTTTSSNGLPPVSTPTGTVVPALTHVVYTRNVAGDRRIYIDGFEVINDPRSGDLSNWAANHYFVLGNEAGPLPTRPWYGEYRLVAVYDRALTSDEVAGNYLVGPDPQLGPSGCPGDANCDGQVNWRDIDFFVAAQNNNESAWTALFAPGTPSCPFSNNDANSDGNANWRDIDPFVALMNTTCP